jgi:hypothetical protein
LEANRVYERCLREASSDVFGVLAAVPIAEGFPVRMRAAGKNEFSAVRFTMGPIAFSPCREILGLKPKEL